jgi:hypothetical protein
MTVVAHLRAALARMAGLLTPSRAADAELREELEAHLEMEIAEHVRRGMAPSEARRLAMLSSGGLTQAAEAVRDRRGLPWVDGVVADVKYAVRPLLHARAFTAVMRVVRRLAPTAPIDHVLTIAQIRDRSVAPHDPITFAGVAGLMAAIGIVACWIPARRAARVDPAITMRSM